MSRVGKKPIHIPSGIEVSVQGSRIMFKGNKLQKELETHGRVEICCENNEISFKPINQEPQSRAYWGTYRALANNIILGMSTGFTKVLEVNGVGYKVAVSGKTLELALGFSHPVKYPIPDGIEMSVDKNTITIKGSDKQQVGQIAAEIREFRPPEPYKGKGIKYSDEVILRKAGKTAKK
ncbi:50S ribosomal protein L6 [Helicobacter mustelae]|uniref:Large ribosomal subunit protein uL6 n=1 Tax=Helicobacter mustelae (strain ATCC 43772 / CCUG 25715 / CIP 103759 / LMG 18044 / NCTC 12198 / R85-136P) TaxID=679897 RepID=D3UIH4_HELM1|nr:50S ribosomal protein L6 [Helicobacter mustelae]CBG40297.1 50S ribosomal protein L6 [Helicobacter mustelae 12198]SQH71797.1 50S ribosomal protein L6 [Helicobacter mustelae]